MDIKYENIKSRTVLGVICIVVSLLICFGITPLFNKEISKKIEIVRVVKDIKIGDKVTGDMVRSVEVGSLNLPSEVMKNKENVIGKYASADMVPGDYIINSKVADEPAAENAYLYNLSGENRLFPCSEIFCNRIIWKTQIWRYCICDRTGLPETGRNGHPPRTQIC